MNKLLQLGDMVRGRGIGGQRGINAIVGPEQATLQVPDNAAGSPQSALVMRTGIATTPGVSISPPTVDFGTAMEGATVATKTIQVMNSGTSALHVSTNSVSGSNPGDFFFFRKPALA
jgi:hypothetical protein